MSYLPRMSKTYKEPEQLVFDEPEEDTSTNVLKPASSLLNEKLYNPQTILKHYRYHPHPLPVLPGPSVFEEAAENELYKENSRLRRSASKMETISKASENVKEEPVEEKGASEDASGKEIPSEAEENLKRPQSRKGIKKSKSNLGKRKSAKSLRRENTSKTIINVSMIKTANPFSAEEGEKTPLDLGDDLDLEFFSSNDKNLDFLKSLPSISSVTKPPKTRNLMELLKEQQRETQSEKFLHESTQCAIVGSFSKLFVIPQVIHSLLSVLSFLLHEINKEALSSYSKEKRVILAQSQLLLDNLCSEKADKEYGFDITYSDSKRLEKMLGELKKYMRDVYGDKSERVDKLEDLKKVFMELRKKEMELFDLAEKLEEIDEAPKDIIVKEKDLKNPEVTLQNNRLESEQLTAEVEFSLIELRNYQKSLAELDWEIKNFQKQMLNLKKSTMSNSKTEVLGKKCRFQAELTPKTHRSSDSESNSKKKT